MRISRHKPIANRTRVAVLTADGAFAQAVQDAFAAAAQFELVVMPGRLGTAPALDLKDTTVLVVDVDAAADGDMQALQALAARTGGWPPIVAVTQSFDAAVARRLLQMRVADFLAKPVEPTELLRACAQAPKGAAGAEAAEAQIYTFLPAVGGAGSTTLAIQTAMLLLQHAPRGRSSTCLVDLDFQNGACADYLDLEPRLNLDEIEPRPERLDRQLLEVMLSHHASGLAVMAAPNRPAVLRSYDPEMVMRLLDLVSAHFDHVVFDLPRAWFSWTDSVLLGSNRLFVVCEMTVPGLRHGRQLADAIASRLKDGPPPQVIVNRFEQRLFGAGLRRSDVEQALGPAFAAAIPNDYRLVREAIDRGVPLDEVKAGNRIARELKKLLQPTEPAAAAAPASSMARLKLALQRA